MFSDLFYFSNAEYEQYKSLIHSYSMVYFFLFPNFVSIHQIENIDEKFIEENLSMFRLALIPVYKHLWKRSYMKIIYGDTRSIMMNYETSKGNIFSARTQPINAVVNKQNKTISATIDDVEYQFSYQAFSFLSIGQMVNIEKLNYIQLLGVVKTAIRLGFLSSGRDNKNIRFSERPKNPFNTDMRRFQKIKLKSLEAINQIRFFDVWYKKKPCVVTGSTGVGKTSQIPKIFLWFNYLFGGYDICLNSKLIDLDLEYTGKDKTMLIFPRKALIVSNGENLLKSIGYRDKNDRMIIEGSPVTMNFKNVSDTIYYNNKCQGTELNMCINRIAASYKIGDHKLSTIIVDEIHEHETFSDICISILRNKIKRFNNIVLMSATIDEDKDRIQQYFMNKIEFIHIEGDKLYPVTEIDIGPDFSVSDIIMKYKPDRGKSGIFFFPRISDIEYNYRKLNESFEGDNEFSFFIMHSKVDTSPSDVIKMIEDNRGKRSIVLSTNILESSLTLVTAQYVYDTGLFFCKMFYGGKIETITKSMAEQRKGRVGRKAPGIYVSLYDIGKLNDRMKKIDHEFLYPYIIFFKMLKIDFNDLFIMPSDMSRFDRTIKYLEQNNIPVNNQNHIKKIFRIYNRFSCSMIEYIQIYIDNINTKLLNEFEQLITNEDKLTFILNNRNLLHDLKNLNIICNFRRKIIKENSENKILMDVTVTLTNKLLDGDKTIAGKTLRSTEDIKYFMISPNLFLPLNI